MSVLRKDPRHGFTFKKCVLGWQNQASMASAVLFGLLRGPRVLTVTTTLSTDGKTSQRLRHAAQGGGSKVTSVALALQPL